MKHCLLFAFNTFSRFLFIAKCSAVTVDDAFEKEVKTKIMIKAHAKLLYFENIRHKQF